MEDLKKMLKEKETLERIVSETLIVSLDEKISGFLRVVNRNPSLTEIIVSSQYYCNDTHNLKFIKDSKMKIQLYISDENQNYVAWNQFTEKEHAVDILTSRLKSMEWLIDYCKYSLHKRIEVLKSFQDTYQPEYPVEEQV